VQGCQSINQFGHSSVDRVATAPFWLIDTQPSVCSIHFGENTELTNDKGPHNCVTLPEKESSKYGSTGGQKDIVGSWSPEVFPCDKREGGLINCMQFIYTSVTDMQIVIN